MSSFVLKSYSGFEIFIVIYCFKNYTVLEVVKLLSFNIDRKKIENKYHKTDEPFDPYNRMAYHGYAFDEATGKSDDEIRAGLETITKETENLPHPIAKAKAIKYVLDNTRIDINESDFFVGFWSVYRLIWPTTIGKWLDQIYSGEISDTKALMDDLNCSSAVSIWADFDHVVPDWDSIMNLGFKGLRVRANNYREMHKADGTLTPEMDAHFEGIDIEYGAIIDIIDRLYNLALTKNHSKAKKMAECLKNIRDGAPKNIYEAMQVIYIYFIVSESFDCYQVRSLGNGLDNTLYRFYKNDIENGIYTREEIKELLAYFLMQWQAIGNYWGQPFYMGGTNLDGTTKYNELSMDILDVYDEIGIYNPKIQIKVNENTPDEILNKVFDMIRRGHNCFALICEPGYIKAVMSYGATYEEAVNMDIRGCYETGVRANEVCTGTGYVNALKPIEYVFSNGFDKRLNKQFGLQTGNLSNLKTFDDFYNAVIRQWGNIIELSLKASDSYEKYLGYVNPSNMYSATIVESLKKGLDAYQNGVKFNNSAILNCGFASLVDSVMAVKKLVYDTKTVTLAELKDALEADWEGFEELRTKALKSKHKYGNGDTETDMYAESLAAFFANKVNNRPNARGGVYKAIMHSAMQFVWQGEKTGATPDGRKTGDEESKNASPSVGMDKNGVTALINSVLKIHPYTYTESFCLDVMLHPSAVSGDEGLAVMKSLLMTYLKGNGMAIQFNVFNTDTLKDAQKNPEKYQNLQVRVCGWNALWNNIPKKQQDAYIERCENVK